LKKDEEEIANWRKIDETLDCKVHYQLAIKDQLGMEILLKILNLDKEYGFLLTNPSGILIGSRDTLLITSKKLLQIGDFGLYEGKFNEKPVSLKIVDPAENSKIEKLLIEAVVRKPLKSPFLVEMYCIDADNPKKNEGSLVACRFIFISEKANYNLRKIIFEEKLKYKVKSKIKILMDILQALKFAHSKKIILGNMRMNHVFVNKSPDEMSSDVDISAKLGHFQISDYYKENQI